MKVLYVCGTYAPRAFAGSELSAHELLAQLGQRSGIQTLVATDVRYTNGRPGFGRFEGVHLVGMSHQDRRQGIELAIDDFRPDVILTQLLWSDVAVSIGRSRGVPTVLRIPSMAPDQDLRAPTALIAVSRHLVEWASRTHGVECHLIPSVVRLERVVASDGVRDPQFIAMFNPITIKGGEVFRQIAERMPERRFAAVRGWHSLRRANGSWNEDVLVNSLESQNASDLNWRPVDVALSGLGNCEYLEPRENVSEIYAMVRLLLIPSQYAEAFGRVCIEAFANGIPVLGSKVGGLQEHITLGGRLVPDFKDPDAWIKAILEFDDPDIYAEYSTKARSYVEKHFDNERTVDQVVALFESLVR
jgi:hypothetical protein